MRWSWLYILSTQTKPTFPNLHSHCLLTAQLLSISLLTHVPTSLLYYTMPMKTPPIKSSRGQSRVAAAFAGTESKPSIPTRTTSSPFLVNQVQFRSNEANNDHSHHSTKKHVTSLDNIIHRGRLVNCSFVHSVNEWTKLEVMMAVLYALICSTTTVASCVRISFSSIATVLQTLVNTLMRHWGNHKTWTQPHEVVLLLPLQNVCSYEFVVDLWDNNHQVKQERSVKETNSH